MTTEYPAIRQQHCLNTRLAEHAGDLQGACTRCRDICPAEAISLDGKGAPVLSIASCTNCTACVRICPADAITQAELDPVSILQQAQQRAAAGHTELHVACLAAKDRPAHAIIACHASWSPALLASLAAEGIRTLQTRGTERCNTCPRRHGASVFARTRKDYAELNRALDRHLEIRNDAPAEEKPERRQSAPVPARRAFFRQLLPGMAKTAIKTAAQVNKAVNDATVTESADRHRHLPLQLRLFLRALPNLRVNFTPVPAMPSLPLGAIQADDACSACGDCVAGCPTQALTLREFGVNHVLELQPDACIGCNQCSRICPENAIEVLPAVSLPALLTGKERPLVMVSSNRHNKGLRKSKETTGG